MLLWKKCWSKTSKNLTITEMNGNMAEDGGLAEDGIVKQVEYIFVDQLNNRDICSYVFAAMHSHQLSQFN